MKIHSQIKVIILAGNPVPKLKPLITYFSGIKHINLSIVTDLPEDLSTFNVVITLQTSDIKLKTKGLDEFVRSGGGWLGLINLSEGPVPEIFGAQPAPIGPESEIRVLFKDQENPLSVRLPDAIYACGRFQPLEIFADNSEIILYADWHYQHRPVLISRSAGSGLTACTTLQAYDHPVIQQILYRLIRRLAGKTKVGKTLGVGILGYAPSVGRYHGIGTNKTPGLDLRGVCDLNSVRLEQAQIDFGDIKTYKSSETFAQNPGIDVVIVATAPNTHAKLCLDMMAAGKHVVCEKPLALTLKETDLLTAESEKLKLHLSCHQNRRWDVDYLAIRQTLAERTIGDLFYIETFVGGFNHPCGYWHSHAPISGGTAYDWGGHYIDWIVSLISDRAVSVVCTGHKRVWHDVTNSDQECIRIRFAGGQEAEFMHSDIAAIRKPKWYLLGTQGALIGRWKDVTTFDIDPVLYFHRNNIPSTEMPPEITLCRRIREGETSIQTLPLPSRKDYAFHSNLADHLLTGEPIEATLDQSISVVQILEAASKSFKSGGKEVMIDG